MERAELKKVVETLLFITDRPVSAAELAKLAELKAVEDVDAAVRELQSDYASRDSAIRILEIAEGFQMATAPEFGAWVRKLYQDKTTFRLSTASLETLSIVAYRQPLTRAEVEEIRGVEVIAALETLLERKLIKVVGRKETVGRPLLYGTTPEFLRQFGLRSMEELPSLETFVPPKEEAAAAAAPPPEEPVPIPTLEGGELALAAAAIGASAVESAAAATLEAPVAVDVDDAVAASGREGSDEAASGDAAPAESPEAAEPDVAVIEPQEERAGEPVAAPAEDSASAEPEPEPEETPEA